MSSNKSPIFPIPEPHHFSDYGFDPQIGYFQMKMEVLEEARKHKREASSRSIDALHFKLQKPISKDESKKIRKCSKRRWWRNALLFFRRRWSRRDSDRDHDGGIGVVRRGSSVCGPVYFTESRIGSGSGPCRTACKPSSGTLAGTLMPRRKGELEIPYISLSELNMEPPQQRISTPHMPIYLVT